MAVEKRLCRGIAKRACWLNSRDTYEARKISRLFSYAGSANRARRKLCALAIASRSDGRANAGNEAGHRRLRRRQISANNSDKEILPGAVGSANTSKGRSN